MTIPSRTDEVPGDDQLKPHDRHGFLIDLDGVIWRGHETVPGAPEAAAKLIEGGVPVLFLTNNPRATAESRAERLRELGVPAREEQVLTAGRATAEVAAATARRRRAARAGAQARRGSTAGNGKATGAAAPAATAAALPQVYAIGNSSFLAEVAATGVSLVPTPPLPDADIGASGPETPLLPARPDSPVGSEPPDARQPHRERLGAEVDVVVVAGHTGFDYAELKAAADAILAGADFLAVNRDPTGPMPDGPWPGTGAIVAAIESATGRTAEVCGKPAPEYFQAAIRRLCEGPPGISAPTDRAPGDSPLPEEAAIAMIGDRLDSDISGAQAAGLEAILVMSGSTTAEDLAASDIEPDAVLDSLADL